MGLKTPSTFCWLQLAKYVHSSLCNMIQAPDEPPLAAKFGINSFQGSKDDLLNSPT